MRYILSDELGNLFGREGLSKLLDSLVDVINSVHCLS